MCIGPAPLTCVKLILGPKNFCSKWLQFHKEIISAKFVWGNVLFGEKLQIYAKNSNFYNFDSALYIKSVTLDIQKYICMVLPEMSSFVLACVNIPIYYFYYLLGSIWYQNKVKRRFCLKKKKVFRFTSTI